ncbi:hypothetical protein L4D00_04605 [Photobacterium swingsii]|uniref:Uncharacterized protein n=1 Tax=Photobacterium swingsii TaxID=680026 RepID=A0A0J8V620_9GAMM|nr:hypothetical protein [Photobacterium swingsii]KMV28617.1 hypothetical protein AB733_22555 [Photobacterium swingsii]PSW21579.1 hypothetical protein C9I94_21115 [Photobacterium swingsii]
MFKKGLTTCAVIIAALASSTHVMAQRDIQEKRQEVRQEARIESRTEARIENRHSPKTVATNVVVIQNAMLRTVSYNGIVLLHDTVNQRFYRAKDNGYEVYSVPFGANVVQLSQANPMNITIIN